MLFSAELSLKHNSMFISMLQVMSMFSTTTPQQRKVQEVTVQKRSCRLFVATFHSHSAFIITVICVCKGELFIFIFPAVRCCFVQHSRYFFRGSLFSRPTERTCNSKIGGEGTLLVSKLPGATTFQQERNHLRRKGNNSFKCMMF